MLPSAQRRGARLARRASISSIRFFIAVDPTEGVKGLSRPERHDFNSYLQNRELVETPMLPAFADIIAAGGTGDLAFVATASSAVSLGFIDADLLHQFTSIEPARRQAQKARARQGEAVRHRARPSVRPASLAAFRRITAEQHAGRRLFPRGLGVDRQRVHACVKFMR